MNCAELKVRIHGALSVAECEALASAARSLPAPSFALEVGHWKGLSTAILLQSLPVGSELQTIDHHEGDRWAPAVPIEDYVANVEPFIGSVSLHPWFMPFGDALPLIQGSFRFVFYDADHEKAAIEDFWKAVRSKLADDCVLVFDDADWESQALLGELAIDEGFHRDRTRPFQRCLGDKRNPDTYTLEILRRGDWP